MKLTPKTIQDLSVGPFVTLTKEGITVSKPAFQLLKKPIVVFHEDNGNLTMEESPEGFLIKNNKGAGVYRIQSRPLGRYLMNKLGQTNAQRYDVKKEKDGKFSLTKKLKR